MTLDISQSAPCQHRLRVHIKRQAIRPVEESVVRQFQREAAIAGFRKGKAPRELVERQYAEEIRKELLRRLTHQILEQVTSEQRLKPVGPFEVTQLSFDETEGLALEAQVEVEPQFPLADYRGICLEKQGISVGAQDVEQALGRIQESMAELTPAQEGQAKEKRLPKIDDEFARDAGFDSLDQLRKHLEAKLYEQKRAQQAQGLEQSLCDALLARHQFEVPAGLVAKQTQRLRRDFEVRCLLAGLPEEKVKEALAKYDDELRTNATRLLKIGFVLERIAEKEAISVTQDEIVDRLWRLAKQWGKDPSEVRRLLDAKGLWPSVLSSIRQDKTVSFLLSVAYIEEIEPLAH